MNVGTLISQAPNVTFILRFNGIVESYMNVLCMGGIVITASEWTLNCCLQVNCTKNKKINNLG